MARWNRARAASSGRPNRSSGMRLARAMPWVQCGPVLARLRLALVTAAPLARLDDADQDRVHADALRREFDRERLDEAQHAGARRRRRHHVRLRLQLRAASSRRRWPRRRGSRSSGRKARVGRMMLKYLRSSSSRQASSVVSAKVETRPWPALFTSMSARPKRAATAPAKASTWPASSTSQRAASSGAPGWRSRSPASACAQALAVATADRHRGACLQEQVGGGQADAGRTARDHRHLPGQIDFDHRNPNAFR